RGFPYAPVRRLCYHREVNPKGGTSMRTVLPGLILAAVLAPAARAGGPAPDPDGLVAKLGSVKYAERAAAMAALDQLGPAALDALRKASQHPDPEVRHRAAVLVQRIEYRAEVVRLVGGKKLRLVYQNVPVLDAVKDFATRAGIAMDVEGDRMPVRERKITMDTGEVTFWEAFEAFCREAGL